MHGTPACFLLSLALTQSLCDIDYVAWLCRVNHVEKRRYPRQPDSILSLKTGFDDERKC